MEWLRRYGPMLALAIVALIALGAGVFITFDGVETADGRPCGSLWSRDDDSAACEEQLDQHAGARIGAAAAAAVAAGGAGGLWLRDRRRVKRSVIETERLRIRLAKPADAAEVGGTLDDETLAALRWSAPDRNTVVAMVSGGRSSTFWVVCDKGTGRIVGAITAPANTQKQHAATLGFWMAPAHRGQRLMPEAIRGIVGRLHADGITVVDATVPVGNDSAIQALDAAEFRVQRREGDLVVYRSERRAAR